MTSALCRIVITPLVAGEAGVIPLQEFELIINIVLVLAAALIGGLLAQLLRLPVIVGYLVAGVLVGPHTPGPVTDVEQARTAADLGVALLMFTLGIQLSFRQLAPVRRIALYGAPIQILLSIGLGALISPLLGIGMGAGVFVGATLAHSSTAVAFKVLSPRGKMDQLEGRISVGMSVIQDISVVPMMVILPAVLGNTDGAWLDLLAAIAKALALLAGTYLLATRLMPRLLFRLATLQMRELFLLTVISLGLGLALLSAWLGLSLAFGAFLAGLILSESEYSYQALGEILPLRDLFIIVFFVSMGMLIDLSLLVTNPVPILTLTATTVVGKFLIIAVLALVFGYSLSVALGAGLVLAQMGEFAFVMASFGVSEGLIDGRTNEIILGAAMLTIILLPFVYLAQTPLERGLLALPLIGQRLTQPVGVYNSEVSQGLSRHVVVGGYGQTGRELVEILSRRGFNYLVIEQDPYIIRSLRERNVPCIYGDITNRAVLEQCRLEQARVMAITIADSVTAAAAVQIAKRINPSLDIIVRGGDLTSHQALRQAGATEIVHPQFEAGLEFVRHTLHRYGVPSVQVQALINRRRIEYYEG